MSITNSNHSLSNLYMRKTVDELLWLLKWERINAAIFVVLCIGVVAMSSFFADISGEAGKFDDPSEDFQACYTQADYTLIPLTSLVLNSPTITCTVGSICNAAYGNQTDTLTCLGASGAVNCLSGGGGLGNIPIPVGHLLNSLSNLGIQIIIFGSIAHAATDRALRHPSWLLSTVGLCIWFLFAIFTYYTVSPVFPVPNQTNSTLLVLLLYGGSYEKYNDFNGGDNNCRPAFSYLWIYLSILVAIGVTVLITVIIGIYAENIRYKSKNKKHYDQLAFTTPPLALGGVAVILYLVIASAKASASGNALQAISDFNLTVAEAGEQGLGVWFPSIWFPFVQPALDIGTIVYICTFMSILRGYTIQSISAFRLAFISAFVFTISGYPQIIGAFQFYYYENFNNYDDCWNYFYEGEKRAYFGYPDEDQSKLYCDSFRLSLAGNTGLFVVMHILTVLCFLTTQQNHDRDSQVFEPLEDTQRRLGMSGKNNPMHNPTAASDNGSRNSYGRNSNASNYTPPDLH